MRRDGAGWRPVARSCPSPRRGPAQAPGSPAQKQERRREPEVLRAELEGERLHSPELRRWARPEGPPGHRGHQDMQSSCSPDGNGPRAMAAASRHIEPRSFRLALRETPPESHSAGQQATRRAVADALLQVPEPAREDLVLPGSARSRLLEQKARLQRALGDLERQRGALEMENRLLRKGSSPEGCKEAERLQQKSAKLAALTEQLKERCRRLQETIERLTHPPVPLPIQSPAEELGTKSLPQQRAGERRELAPALLAQDKQNEASRKAAEELQALQAADSYYVSTLRQRCEELEGQLTEMTGENTRLAEENSRLRGQMRWAEKVQAENADLKGQLTRVAEKQNSATRAISCLQTRLEDAERKLKAMTEMAERRQQLEKEGEATKSALRRKEKEDEFLQRAQAEGKREHQEAMQVFRDQVTGLDNPFQSPSESAWAEDSPGSCLLSEEDPASETEEPVADKLSVIPQALRPQLGKLRTFIARYSYDPFDGPSQQPELELPLTAGQHVYVFGQVDEDGWYVGELADGRRGFIPSNCVKELSDDDLENKNWNDPRYYLFCLSPILEEDEEDLDVGVGG